MSKLAFIQRLISVVDCHEAQSIARGGGSPNLHACFITAGSFWLHESFLGWGVFVLAGGESFCVSGLRLRFGTRMVSTAKNGRGALEGKKQVLKR